MSDPRVNQSQAQTPPPQYREHYNAFGVTLIVVAVVVFVVGIPLGMQASNTTYGLIGSSTIQLAYPIWAGTTLLAIMLGFMGEVIIVLCHIRDLLRERHNK